jgi:recombination protein RecA
MTKKLDMGFLKTFNKDLASMDGVGTSSIPPRYWYSTGNYTLNRIISGSFTKGIPQGRITDLAGASGSGKSFVAANLVKAAQQAGAFCLVIDSENALDDEFMTKIGVDTETGYQYVEVTTISQVTKVVSSFLKGYKKQEGESEDAPQVFILIDSLDMLMTDTELEHYEKGDAKGDQGQRNKQLKAMLRTFVQDIKKLNVSMVVTSQVYKNQDVKNGEGVWIVSDAVKYAASQIVLLSKLKLKDDSGKIQSYAGILMKCEGYKTRFTAPFQRIVIEVPYATGMNPHSGLVETAKELGIIESRGAWQYLVGTDIKFYAKNISEYADRILAECEKHTDTRLSGKYIDNDEEPIDEQSAKSRRMDKVASD